ncbi:MAG: rod shape-determining protein [Christensenellales bacterium]|jgi:rod shape-determining protein MreB
MGRNIAIDLGTASVLVYVEGEGIVMREPSVVAVNKREKRVLAVGTEANRMIGRTSGEIIAVRPLRDGVIADFEVTEAMLRYFMRAALRRCSALWRKPSKAVICVPCGVTEVEKRSVEMAARRAGVRDAFIAEEPMAAALGAGLPVSEPIGSMVVDIGGGTTEMAVISLNGIVVSESLRIAGDRMDELIIAHARKKYSLAMGEKTAEEVKIVLGTAMPPRSNDIYEVRGRSLKNGLPVTVHYTARDAYEALGDIVQKIIEYIRNLLEETPPEIMGDILHGGITLTGGGALLRDLDIAINRETGIPVYIAQNPLDCVVLGAGMMLSSITSYCPSRSRRKQRGEPRR